MRDLIDFLFWFGLTLISAVGFTQGGGLYVDGLDGPELMALGLCTSIVGGSGAFLMFRGLFRAAVGLSLFSMRLPGRSGCAGAIKPLGDYLAHG